MLTKRMELEKITFFDTTHMNTTKENKVYNIAYVLVSKYDRKKS